MNKLIRQQLRDKHWRRRVKQRRAHASHTLPPGSREYDLRDQATPCSCWMCDPHWTGDMKFSARKREMIHT